MCTSNEDCSNCAPSEGNIQGPFPIGPNGAHMKINAGLRQTISGQSEWSHSGRSPATGGADSRGVDPHQEAWLSASFDTWFLQGAAGCDARSGVEGNPVCFENDADGNPAAIAPGADNYNPDCEGSILLGPDQHLLREPPWPETFDAVPCRAGYGLSAMVQERARELPVEPGSPRRHAAAGPIDCTHPMAAACIEGCTGGAIGCGGCGANNAMNVALQIGPYTGMTPEEAQTASWATVCPQKCGNPNYELAEGENACDTSCIPFIGCFNCDESKHAGRAPA